MRARAYKSDLERARGRVADGVVILWRNGSTGSRQRANWLHGAAVVQALDREGVYRELCFLSELAAFIDMGGAA